MIIQQIFGGLLLIIVGVVTLKFNYQLTGLVRLQWIESKMGSGSTYLVYKLLSIVLVLAGITYMAGFADNVADWALSPLRSLFQTR